VLLQYRCMCGPLVLLHSDDHGGIPAGHLRLPLLFLWALVSRVAPVQLQRAKWQGGWDCSGPDAAADCDAINPRLQQT
jgi:hypothetical protein